MLTASIPLDSRKRKLWTSGTWATVAVVVLTIGGFGLRLMAARGDLWLDEIWTYRLLEGGASFTRIFLALPYDNNHVLTTSWLAMVGPDASPLLARLPAALCGTICIPVAARIWRHGHPSAAVAAATLVALDGMLVQYGSEARGYSGMVLAVFIALDSLECFLDDPTRRRPLVSLSLAVAFGTFSQLTMVAATLVLGATALIRLRLTERRSPSSGRAVGAVFASLLGGTLPAVVCLVVSIFHAGLHTGLRTPFSWDFFAIGMARMAEATLGLPDRFGDPTVICLLAAAGCVVGLVFVERERRVFPALAIFGLPALQCLLRVPNEQYARFHLVSSLGILVLAIEVAGRARRAGSMAKAVILGLAGFTLVGHGFYLTRLIDQGRGSFQKPVALMAADGPTTVIVRPKVLSGETAAVVHWYAAKTDVHIDTIEPSCATHADWVLLAREPGESLSAPDQEIAGKPGCAARFTLRSAYPAYGLSGFTWLVFHRDGALQP